MTLLADNHVLPLGNGAPVQRGPIDPIDLVPL